MDVDTISDFLSEQRNKAPTDLQAAILQFEDLWERKLWHQLTNALIDFFNHPDSAPQRLPFYKVFISKFADKINQLKLVDMALKALTQCRDHQERLSFMSDVAKRVNKPNSQDAFVHATIAVASVLLDLSDLVGARRDLDTAEKLLDQFDSVETAVHAAFYDTSARYFQARSDYGAYYRNALLYLACIDLDDLSPAERCTRAYNLSTAALVSTNIYNFGELLLHPILGALSSSSSSAATAPTLSSSRNPPTSRQSRATMTAKPQAAAAGGDHDWLRQLLFAFNRGDLGAYDMLANHVAADPLLGQHVTQLRQKMYLAALTEAVFRRSPHDRAMAFATIAAETKVRPDEIEHLIMRALSLGLLRGTIDQVDQVAMINWVQPKVLDMGQIENMRLRLKTWDENVNLLGNWIESVGQDVWAA